jgi:hypothetical protein
MAPCSVLFDVENGGLVDIKLSGQRYQVATHQALFQALLDFANLRFLQSRGTATFAYRKRAVRF